MNEDKLDKLDEIKVYRSSNEYRWVRRTTTNWKIIGASTEGYSRAEGALANIQRTQRGPYVLIRDDFKE